MPAPAHAGTEPLSLTISRVYNAPRDVVFRAWTDPAQLRRWCAPTGFTIPVADGELRPGGSWRSTMRAPDGREYHLVGRYAEIVEPERLVFTHAWLAADGGPGCETLVTVTLEERDGRTLLTLVQSGFDTVAARDGHTGGWGETLDRLADHLWER